MQVENFNVLCPRVIPKERFRKNSDSRLIGRQPHSSFAEKYRHILLIFDSFITEQFTTTIMR